MDATQLGQIAASVVAVAVGAYAMHCATKAQATKISVSCAKCGKPLVDGVARCGYCDEPVPKK